MSGRAQSPPLNSQLKIRSTILRPSAGFRFNPNAAVAAASAVGSTGHWPVPGGDPPLGREQTPELFRTLLGKVGRLPVPSGQWPDGTGGSPVLPIPTSEFGLNAIGFTAQRKRVVFPNCPGR